MPIYPSQIEVDYFDPELYDLYWRMIAERQNMYVRRVLLGQARPWTTDPILNSEFITNMYREMDPGTQYVVRNILSMAKPEDRLFNVMMYRLMGSQATTHQLITSPAKTFKLDKYLAAIGTIEKGKLFGDAYRVAGYETEGGATKGENVGIMFARLAKQVPEILAQLKNTTNTREAYDVIKGISGFGDFLAHQVTVDLLYKNAEGDAVLPFGENDWAMPGPGARSGIWALLKPDIKPRNLLIVMQFLQQRQDQEFAARGIDFPYLADEDGEPILLSLCNIQSTLCEFFKYVRLWDGSAQKVRRYIPSKEASELEKLPVAMSFEQTLAIGSLPQLTPPPPVGGRKLPDMAASEPTPDIDPEPEKDKTPEEGRLDELAASVESSSEALKRNLEGFPQQLVSLPMVGGGQLTINVVINVYPEPVPND